MEHRYDYGPYHIVLDNIGGNAGRAAYFALVALECNVALLQAMSPGRLTPTARVKDQRFYCQGTQGEQNLLLEGTRVQGLFNVNYLEISTLLAGISQGVLELDSNVPDLRISVFKKFDPRLILKGTWAVHIPNARIANVSIPQTF